MNTKRILLLACAVILVATEAMGQVPSGDQGKQSELASWKRYTVKSEEFSVMLPTLPTMTTSKTPIPRLQKDRFERKLEAYADPVSYTIRVYENAKPRLSLEEFINEQMASKEWPATYVRSISISGFEGKEYKSLTTSQPGTILFFATKERLYSFGAEGATIEDARVSQFLSSIVLGKSDGIEVAEGSNATSNDTRTYLAKDVDSKIRLTKKPEPTYPDSAEAKKIVGTVVLRCIFTAEGTVTNIKVLSGLPHGLTEKAIEAARQIKFIPATKDGKNVSMWIQLEYNFDLFRYR